MAIERFNRALDALAAAKLQPEIFTRVVRVLAPVLIDELSNPPPREPSGRRRRRKRPGPKPSTPKPGGRRRRRKDASEPSGEATSANARAPLQPAKPSGRPDRMAVEVSADDKPSAPAAPSTPPTTAKPAKPDGRRRRKSDEARARDFVEQHLELDLWSPQDEITAEAERLRIPGAALQQALESLNVTQRSVDPGDGHVRLCWRRPARRRGPAAEQHAAATA